MYSRTVSSRETDLYFNLLRICGRAFVSPAESIEDGLVRLGQTQHDAYSNTRKQYSDSPLLQSTKHLYTIVKYTTQLIKYIQNKRE